MSELVASNKHIPFSLCAFTIGKKTHFRNSLKCEVKLQALLPSHPPPSKLHRGDLLGKASKMKSDASSVKEGCPKPGEMSPQLGSGPRSQRGKLGQRARERKEGFCIYSSCQSQSVTQR